MKLAVLVAILSFAAQAADEAPLELLHVHGNVYMLASKLGNVTIQVGKDPGHEGVLLVDTGSAAMAGNIAAEIRKLSQEAVRFIVNTRESTNSPMSWKKYWYLTVH